MPGDLASAKAQGLKTASANGWTSGGVTSVDPEPVPGQLSQLKVTITTTVNNTFSQLLGKPTEDDHPERGGDLSGAAATGQPVQRVRQRSRRR